MSITKIKEIKNLNNIRRDNTRGVFKRWLLKNTKNHDVVCDYMEKIRYCIEDLNNEIKRLDHFQRNDVVYIIMLVFWISEAMYNIRILYREDVLKNFKYEYDVELSKMYKYLKALRSFVVAHPLTTNQHSEYGFDGDLFCVDIISQKKHIIFPFINERNCFYLTYDGLKNGKPECFECDVHLRCYRKNEDGSRYACCICFKLSDLYEIANLYVDKLYAIDEYLSKQKKKDYI